jgi:hypothetical protein
MGGISTRNFKMFRKLCGDSALKNVVIVTNRWGEVDPRVGEAREAELSKDDMFFKPVLDKGARMARHEDTVPSAEKIIRLILQNHPLPLRIQEELVTEGKKVTETDAGEELDWKLNAQIRKHEREKQVLMENMHKAIREKDEEIKRNLEIKTLRMKIEMERLKSDHEEERERLKARIRQVESEGKKESERVAAIYQKPIDELKERFKNDARIRAGIVQLEMKVALGLALMSPQEERDGAGKIIAFVFLFCSLELFLLLTPHILNLISHRSATIYRSLNSVMGATGSGKSTVRAIQFCDACITE